MALRSVLFVTYHFPPSAAVGGHRLLGFSQQLPKFGWRSIVVSPPSVPGEPRDETLLERVPRETVLYRAPFPSGLLWTPFRRVARYGVWLPGAWVACRRAIRKYHPEAFLTTGPPHEVNLLGLWLKRFWGLPWVADFRDPWVSGDRCTMRHGIAKWELHAEPAVMKHADAIIANTPRACEILQGAYPGHAYKMEAITNGFDPENFDVNPVAPMAGELVDIVHPGQLYAKRDPLPFLDAVAQIRPEEVPGRRTLRVRFIGAIGDGTERLNQKIRADHLENHVFNCGYISHAQSLREMSRADILLLLDTPGRRAGVPAKVYEYLGAGRPILALGETNADLQWVLSESGRPFRLLPANDPAAIRRGLLELMAECADLPALADPRSACAQFTREQVTRRLVSVLERCTGASSEHSDRRAPPVLAGRAD